MSTPSLSSAVGTGFGTATAGVPWAPTCPSTVSAGDILLAFISCRNLTTNPVTPVGWTLLNGPQANGTGRAWLFGKIADGTEASSAISFGTAISAINQSGQIFRIIGNNYTGQSITNVVLGFASTNGTGAGVNAANVTTAFANCLALQFLKIDDNNTVGNFSGEAGADYVEGPVEYTNNLSTGVTLQVQSATKATAGAITGGTLTQSAADPWVIIGCYVREPLVNLNGVAVVHGGGAPIALGQRTYVEGVIITGGGRLTATGTSFVLTRSGTALIHGGGTLVATGTKTSSVGNAVLSGGGRIVATHITSSGATLTISGGGSLVARATTTGIIVGVRISGGGLVTANIQPVSGNAVIHGGGSAVVTGQGLRVAFIHGGGSLVATATTTGLLAGVVIHGGGSIKINAAEGTASIHGGGSIAVVKSKSAFTPKQSNHRAVAGLVYLFGEAGSALVIHGGGTVIATGIPARGVAVISGGGTVSATKTKNAIRSVVVTGGGQIVVTKLASGAVNAVIHGGGSLAATYNRSSAVGANLTARYDLRALARRNLLVLYDLLEFGTVGANLLVNYHQLVYVNELLAAQYDLRTPIRVNLLAQYDLRRPINMDMVALYDYRALAAIDLIAAYITIGRLKRDFIAVYDVKPLVDDITRGYAVLSRRG